MANDSLAEPFCSLSIELCSMSDAFCFGKMHIPQALARNKLFRFAKKMPPFAFGQKVGSVHGKLAGAYYG